MAALFFWTMPQGDWHPLKVLGACLNHLEDAMAKFNIFNPTTAPRVIFTKDGNSPLKKNDDGKMVPDEMRSHKQIRIGAGETKENVELDDDLVDRLKALAAKAGADKELQLTPVSAAPKKAAA